MMRSFSIRSGKAQLTGVEDGKGPAIVFLHEGLGCVATWGRFPDLIASATSRPALVYSRHGHGGSGPMRTPREPDYMHEEARGVLPELLERLSIRRPLLIGHSDGASVSVLYGAAHPVSALVLIAPHVFVEQVTLDGVRDIRESYRTGPWARRLAGFHDDPDTLFGQWTDIWLSPRFRSWNIEDELVDVTSPVLLVQGEEDEYGTALQLEAVEKGVSGPAQRVDLPRCGHSPHLEQPQRTHEAIVGFIRSLPARDR